jgi:hypothetical protein
VQKIAAPEKVDELALIDELGLQTQIRSGKTPSLGI